MPRSEPSPPRPDRLGPPPKASRPRAGRSAPKLPPLCLEFPGPRSCAGRLRSGCKPRAFQRTTTAPLSLDEARASWDDGALGLDESGLTADGRALAVAGVALSEKEGWLAAEESRVALADLGKALDQRALHSGHAARASGGEGRPTLDASAPLAGESRSAPERQPAPRRGQAKLGGKAWLLPGGEAVRPDGAHGFQVRAATARRDHSGRKRASVCFHDPQ